MDSVPVSDNKDPFTIELRDYVPPTSTDLDVSTHYAQFDAGSGYLFIAHPYVEPLCVEFDDVLGTFNVIRVVVQVRDLEGLYDGLANDEEPSVLTAEHHYNLLNQGWMAPGTIPTPALADGELPPASPTAGPGSGCYSGTGTGRQGWYLH
jgi:hypothetical protein